MSRLRQAPPPDDTATGWKPDPLSGESSGKVRFWDGEKWTGRIRGTATREKSTRGGLLGWVENWPGWVKVTLPIVTVIVVIAALTSDPETESTPKSEPQATAEKKDSPGNEKAIETPPPASTEAAKNPPASTEATDDLRAIVEDADGPVTDPKIKDFVRSGNSVVVFAETPGGGFGGASTTDLGYQASGIFDAIYGEGGFKGNAKIKFTGGLVDSSTGKDLPHALTSEFEMTKAEARRIDWSDQDAIDYGINWSLYRTYVHQAIKMDD